MGFLLRLTPALYFTCNLPALLTQAEALREVEELLDSQSVH